MGICYVRTCCGCCSTKAGCLILCLIDLVYNVCFLAYLLTEIIEKTNRPHYNDTFGGLLTLNIIFGILVLTDLLCLLGLCQGYRLLVLLFCFLRFFSVIIAITVASIACWWSISTGETLTIVFTNLVCVLIVVFRIYFVIVSYSYYQDVIGGRDDSS